MDNKQRYLVGFALGYLTCGSLAMFIIKRQDKEIAELRKKGNVINKIGVALMEDASPEAISQAYKIAVDYKFDEIVDGWDK